MERRVQDGHKDGTILLDTATGRAWFFDMTQTTWWEIERGVVPPRSAAVDSGDGFPPGHVPAPPNR